MQEYLLDGQTPILNSSIDHSARIKFIPHISTKLYHYLWLPLRDQIRHDSAFVIANVHEILFGPTVLVNCRQHFVWRIPDLFYRRMTVYKVQ